MPEKVSYSGQKKVVGNPGGTSHIAPVDWGNVPFKFALCGKSTEGMAVGEAFYMPNQANCQDCLGMMLY